MVSSHHDLNEPSAYAQKVLIFVLMWGLSFLTGKRKTRKDKRYGNPLLVQLYKYLELNPSVRLGTSSFQSGLCDVACFLFKCSRLLNDGSMSLASCEAPQKTGRLPRTSVASRPLHVFGKEWSEQTRRGSRIANLDGCLKFVALLESCGKISSVIRRTNFFSLVRK